MTSQNKEYESLATLIVAARKQERNEIIKAVKIVENFARECIWRDKYEKGYYCPGESESDGPDRCSKCQSFEGHDIIDVADRLKDLCQGHPDA